MINKIKNWFVNIWLWVKLKIRKILIALGIVSICVAAPLAMPKENLTFERLENVVKLEENYLMDFDEDFEIEIGDFKTLDFKPEANLKRWQDECFLKVKYPTAKRIKPIQEDNKLKWKDNKEEVHFYNIPETADKEEAFEFEIILKEKPKTNIVSLEIETQGLDFFYQPPLNEENQEEGLTCTATECKDKDGKVICHRPENVVGSYAVYHSTKQGDYSKMGGKNYRAGKAFHIYRPKMTDAIGNWTWEEMNIDIEKRILTVTIPQEFLDNAVYPISSKGVNFGYETKGLSNRTMSDNWIEGAYFLSGGAGSVDSISVYITECNSNGAIDIKYGIYEYSDESFVGNTVEGTFANGYDNWKTLNISGTVNITNINYWLVWWRGNSSGSDHHYYDNGGTNQFAYRGITYNGFPNPYNIAGYVNWKASIYCTYTAGGGAERRIIITE